MAVEKRTDLRNLPVSIDSLDFYSNRPKRLLFWERPKKPKVASGAYSEQMGILPAIRYAEKQLQIQR